MKTMNNSVYNDTLSLYVKKDKQATIEACYKQLGWVKISEKDNALYEDTKDLNFTRPHIIDNKDDLQFLQVGMENKLNEIGRLEKNKHSKSTLLGICVGLGITALLILGIHLIIENLTNWLMYVGIAISIVSTVCLIVLWKICLSIAKKESAHFEARTAQLNEEIAQICNTANQLIGGKNEQTPQS